MKKRSRDRDLRAWRNKRILALRGTMTFVEIAKEIGTTPSVVSGVMHRAAIKKAASSRANGKNVIKRSVCMSRDLYLEITAIAKSDRTSLSELYRSGIRREIDARTAGRQAAPYD